MGTLTLLIIVATGIVSIMAFSNSHLFEKYRFNAYLSYHNKQYYRLVTHGFLHVDWMHLIINMLVLYSFGPVIETHFDQMGSMGMMRFPNFTYLLFYVSAIAVSSSVSLYKQKDNAYYNAVGASGAVSAIVCAAVFFRPWAKIYFWGILPIPGILFAVLYLVYSQYAAKKANDNVGHDAHFWGSIYGFLFPVLVEPRLINYFFDQLINF